MNLAAWTPEFFTVRTIYPLNNNAVSCEGYEKYKFGTIFSRSHF